MISASEESFVFCAFVRDEGSNSLSWKRSWKDLGGRFDQVSPDRFPLIGVSQPRPLRRTQSFIARP